MRIPELVVYVRHLFLLYDLKAMNWIRKSGLHKDEDREFANEVQALVNEVWRVMKQNPPDLDVARWSKLLIQLDQELEQLKQ